jgi:hypothetical protein
MKRFVKYLVLFALPLLALLVAGEWLVRQYPNSYRYKAEWMDAHADSVQTLVMGASHIYYAVIPDLLGADVFNLSNVSQLYEYDWFLLNRYSARLGRLRNLVLVVDDSAPFEDKMENLPEDWHRCIYYRLYMGYNKHSLLSKYGFEMSRLSSFKLKLEPALQYALTGEADLDCDSLGFCCTFDTPEVFDTTVMNIRSVKVIERHRCKDWSRVENNRDYLFRIADWCQRRGVRLVLVTTPMWQGFYSKINQQQLDTMYSLADQCVARYGAIYKDYMRDPRFQGTDFHDGDHLSRQGAEKFTRILKEEVGGF